MNELVTFTLVRGELFFEFEKGKQNYLHEVRDCPKFKKVYIKELEPLFLMQEKSVEFDAEIELEWDEDYLCDARIEDYELPSEYLDWNRQQFEEIERLI